MELNIIFIETTIVLWCWLLSPTLIDGANILAIFPMAAKSHFSCNEGMMRSLYNAGHKITFVSPFPNEETLKNYTVIDSKRNTPIYIGQSSVSEFKNIGFTKMITILSDIESKYCEDVLGLPQIQNLMNSKEKHYDVMFIELMNMFSCFLPLAEKLNIPVIGTVTLRSWKLASIAMGVPNNPAVIPGEFSIFSDKMTFVERIKNVCQSLYLDYAYYFVIPRKLEEIYERFYTPDLLNKKQISLVFVNNHFTLMPRPTVPNVIDVGGIHMKPAKPLPQNYQKFIDEAKHGAIVFSLGSVLKSSTMNEDMKTAFRDAFAEIPQRVIWKFEERIDNLTDNVMLTKWMPQRDILAHRNVKAFITHCGMSGSYEGITEGVPMILTPLFGDQMSNAALLERLGVGISLDLDSANKEKILETLNAVINDTSYRDAAKKVSEIFKDRPMSSHELIVYWTEYVIRQNGTPYMRTAGADMPLYQYLLFDIIAAAIITIVFSFSLLAKLIKLLRYSFSENNRHYVFSQTNKKKV